MHFLFVTSPGKSKDDTFQKVLVALMDFLSNLEIMQEFKSIGIFWIFLVDFDHQLGFRKKRPDLKHLLGFDLALYIGV